MSTQPSPEPATTSGTQISFDLQDVLSPEEVAKFQAASAEAGAPNLTEHFLDLTLRVKPQLVA